MITEKKVYLNEQDLKSLKKKAEELGYSGRGWLTRLCEKIAREDIAFFDNNLKTTLKALNLRTDL